MSLIHIRQVAVQFRRAIERCRTQLPIQSRDFPHGACGDAVLLLAKFLQENGHTGFWYILRMREDCSHAWLQRGDLIVDITADQFPDQRKSVIVALNPGWHRTFERDLDEKEQVADFEQYDPRTVAEMRHAYRLCISRLER
ncbi:MAG TPA: hypothetical protein VK804_02770 [Bradyrhizobium sp.]|uniref:hypothetical protein n=1 Tax=Bradyrhizobium sp. TaxID=376 RepID=UPI002CE6728D|nr:hypothetical protein [Bradyrhizobium sp.]HTA99373.1 hypothetical protein [Bradyrhizobium sp.]